MKLQSKRITSKKMSYLRKVANPFCWVRKFSTSLAKRKYFKEQQNILVKLNNLHQGQFNGLQEYSNLKLAAILEYANKHCPYYRKQFEIINSNFNNLNLLPLLDKSIIRKFYTQIVSNEIDKLDYYMMNTGGSTGEPLEFPVSPHHDPVHQEFLYRIMGYKAGDKIAAFDGSSVPSELRKNNIYWVTTGNDIPYGSLSYSSLYLTNETTPHYISHLIQLSPSILRGYPSFINDLAVYVLKNNIEIPFHIKGIQLTAENAYDWQIENIKKAFRTSVFFQYGHSEVCVFGFTVDETYEYICSPLYGLTEVLNSDGLHVKEGEIGEIVVTGFYNFALPFIRYRTGDLALFNGNKNGVVRLGKIIGRTQDFIYTKGKERVALTALIFGQHYHSFLNISKWQIIQVIPGEVVIKIVKGENFSTKDETEIKDKFKTICDIDINFDYVDSIPLTKRGKFNFLIQNINC